MATQIFVNLPVKDLNKTIEFFTRLGYSFNPRFTDEKAGCMVISDTIFAMMITEPFFKTFTNREIADASKTVECLLSLSAESREKVDEIVGKAIAAGGKEAMPAQDHGWMYLRSFLDLDGHHWEMAFMDMSALPQS